MRSRVQDATVSAEVRGLVAYLLALGIVVLIGTLVFYEYVVVVF